MRYELCGFLIGGRSPIFIRFHDGKLQCLCESEQAKKTRAINHPNPDKLEKKLMSWISTLTVNVSILVQKHFSISCHF